MAGKLCLIFFVLVIMSVFASADGEEMFDSMENGMVESNRNMEKDDGNGRINSDAIKPNSLAVGVSTIPLPGVDGGFHFQLGPIGSGFEMGGAPLLGGSFPRLVMPYSQPYVVVSLYSQLYARRTQYPYVTPGQQLGEGYDPSRLGSNGPIPSQGENVQASFPPNGIFASSTNN